MRLVSRPPYLAYSSAARSQEEPYRPSLTLSAKSLPTHCRMDSEIMLLVPVHIVPFIDTFYASLTRSYFQGLKGAPSPTRKLLYTLPFSSPPIYGGMYMMADTDRAIVQRTWGINQLRVSIFPLRRFTYFVPRLTTSGRPRVSSLQPQMHSYPHMGLGSNMRSS